MSLSSILCSWIQLTGRNKTWKFEENRPRKLNGTQPLKTMVPSPLFPSSRLISSPKTMVPRAGYHYPFGIGFNPLLLGKPLPFTMCFPILFLDFLWKHAWAQLALTGEIPIIYYVLPHRIGLSGGRIVIGETSIIYYVLPRRAHCHWGNPYYLVGASPSYSPASALGKPLLFSRCFPIIFPGERIGETSII